MPPKLLILLLSSEPYISNIYSLLASSISYVLDSYLSNNHPLPPNSAILYILGPNLLLSSSILYISNFYSLLLSSSTPYIPDSYLLPLSSFISYILDTTPALPSSIFFILDLNPSIYFLITTNFSYLLSFLLYYP